MKKELKPIWKQHNVTFSSYVTKKVSTKVSKLHSCHSLGPCHEHILEPDSIASVARRPERNPQADKPLLRIFVFFIIDVSQPTIVENVKYNKNFLSKLKKRWFVE